MSAAANEATASAPRVRAAAERIVVYQHSDLIYWWAVWAYGYFCALLTWWHGKSVVLVEGGRPVLIFPRAWLGISYVVLMLFVLLFTNARARGLKSLVLFLTIAVVGLLVQLTYGWDQLLSYVPLLLVHMNLAYYLFFSTVLLVVWFFSIFVADRFVYWEFAPGGISKRVLFSEGSENFTTPQVETLRQSDDIFVHRVLGLWFLGFGTGDLDVRFGTPGGGQRIYHLKNVWRIGHIEREINRLVGRRGTVRA
jgi:hypothetical protein